MLEAGGLRSPAEEPSARRFGGAPPAAGAGQRQVDGLIIIAGQV